MPFNHLLSPGFRKQIENRVIVPIVGPTSVGKTSLMRKVVELDSDFNRSTGFTTRPRRKDELIDSYRFLEHTQKQRKQIMDQITTGNILQFAVHPTGYLYGTNFDDYKGKYNLIDVLSSEVINFQALGFMECKTIMVVTSPEVWQARFELRNFSIEESLKRVNEGIESLEWAFNQNENLCWLENSQNIIEQGAQEIINIVKNGYHQKDDKVKLVAEELLNHFNALSGVLRRNLN